MKCYKIIIILFCISVIAPAADEQLNPPDKENKGIMATIALVYQTTRNAVRYAYDELMYIYELRDNVKAIGTFIEKTNDNAVSFYDYSSKLWTDPQNVIVTMRRLENIFDGAENLVFQTTYGFDGALANAETAWDNAAGPVLMPQTDEILKHTGDMLTTVKIHPINKEGSEYSSQINLDKNSQDIKMMQLSVALASDAIAKARAYQNWAIKATQNIGDIEKKFQDSKDNSVLATDMQALWYTLEGVNAKNKLLEHQISELTITSALLGVKVYELSKKKYKEKVIYNGYNSFYLQFAHSPHRKIMEKRAKDEVWNWNNK